MKKIIMLNSLFGPLDLQGQGKEAVHVSLLFDDLAGGFTSRVSALSVNVDKERVGIVGLGRLQGSDVLVGVQRDDAVIVISGGEEGGGVGDGGVDVVERGVFDEILEILGVVSVSVVCGPGVSDGVAVEVKHIHYAYSGDGGAVELRALIDARTDQKSAVRAAEEDRKSVV